MRLLIACALVLVAVGPSFAAPETNKSRTVDDSAKIADILLTRIDLPKEATSVLFCDILKYLQDGSDLTILIDPKVLRERGEEPPQNIHDVVIRLPPMKNVRIETVLRRIVDQLDLDYIITPDHVSITTPSTKDLLTGHARKLPELYPDPDMGEPPVEEFDRLTQLRSTPFVTMSFNNIGADEALKELASRAGRNVVISQGAAEKAKASVTINLSNVAFETAAASLAEAAGLRAFRTGNVVVIVTPERAKQAEDASRFGPHLLCGGLGVGILPTDASALQSKVKDLEEKLKKLTDELVRTKKQSE